MEVSSDKVGYGKVQSVIISALSRENASETARSIAAGILCTSEGKRPCGKCAACGKLARNTHPDVIFVNRLADSKGGLKKEITVDQIREISSDAYILPNEADRKVYIINEAEKMNRSAQNAALKLLEEPPNGAVLLLCTDNPSALLPTVRSRCTEINVNGERDGDWGEAAEKAETYLKLVASGDSAGLLAFSFKNEGMGGDEFLDLMYCVREKVTDMLSGRSGDEGMSRSRLAELAGLAEKCIRYRKANVSVKMLFGAIAAGSPLSDEKQKKEV